MPKSKRDKTVSLTQTNRKGLVLKQQILENVKQYTNKYKRIFLFSVQNTRNSKLLQMREAWPDSKFLFGKIRIIALGLKQALQTEKADDVNKLYNTLRTHPMGGQCGLLFTNSSKQSIITWMKNFEEIEYARSGFMAPELIELPEGPLPQFQHSMEPQLRELGMPTALQQGVVTLIKPYRVCQKGDILTRQQAQILKLFNKPLTVFKLVALGVYTKKHGFAKFNITDEKKNNEQEMDVEESCIT